MISAHDLDNEILTYHKQSASEFPDGMFDTERLYKDLEEKIREQLEYSYEASVEVQVLEYCDYDSDEWDDKAASFYLNEIVKHLRNLGYSANMTLQGFPLFGGEYNLNLVLSVGFELSYNGLISRLSLS